MKKWQNEMKIENFGNFGNLGNLRKVIPSFLISKFSILPYSQTRKLRFKNLGKKFLRFPRFPSFRSGPEGICKYLNFTNL